MSLFRRLPACVEKKPEALPHKTHATVSRVAVGERYAERMMDDRWIGFDGM